MKISKTNLLYVIAFLALNVTSANAQTIKTKIGLGSSEFINIAGSYRVARFDVIGSVGTIFYKPEINKIINLSLGFTFYFGEPAVKSNESPWYFRNLNTYRHARNNFNSFQIDSSTVLLPNGWKKSELLKFNFRFGREFNITSRLGLELDYGLVLNTYIKSEDTGPKKIFVHSGLSHSGELNIFYRLMK